MKWQRGYQSSDVEDNRGRAGGLGGGGALLGPALEIGSRFGLPGIVLALAAFFVLPRLFSSAPQALAPERVAEAPPADEQAQFISFVFDDAQRSWTQLLANGPQPYRKARLVLFSEQTPSGCGSASSAVGPFYCPADERVYIDLTFYEELARRFGAPGDFAQAYVIAHEVGHHVQSVLGIQQRVRRSGLSRQGEESGAVKLELQADCFAGIWARSSQRRDMLESGDIEEGLAAAAAVGDDRLQKQATGTVRPETWTHGSAAMRASWFKRGLSEGTLQACDTFDGRL